MMGGYGMMAGMGWLGMLTMALLWIGVIALVIWGVSNLFRGQQLRTEQDALEILRRRFASGEISREEFAQARAVLQS